MGMKGMCLEEGQGGVPPLSSGPPHPESSPIVLHLMAQVLLCFVFCVGISAITMILSESCCLPAKVVSLSVTAVAMYNLQP